MRHSGNTRARVGVGWYRLDERHGCEYGGLNAVAIRLHSWTAPPDSAPFPGLYPSAGVVTLRELKGYYFGPSCGESPMPKDWLF